jgi:hypothetical protein
MVATFTPTTMPADRRQIYEAFGGYQTVIRTFEQMAADIQTLGGGTGSNAGSKSGSLGINGTVVLVAGTATVPWSAVAAGSRIFLTSQIDGGTPGFLRVSSRVAGTSFTITSSSNTDTSTVAYLALP